MQQERAQALAVTGLENNSIQTEFCHQYVCRASRWMPREKMCVCVCGFVEYILYKYNHVLENSATLLVQKQGKELMTC